ncbi:rhodanese-like domain-containing protein [Thalassotalea mangrovi]|uniref:Rhodanese-like domain-containing protein n=1 Tax=Thalassotalea mangrovi TaxID=2572245 RepID=A0A4U1B8P8_9GAMM|nr:rhodanese-like domain-containing protein [Thalassotalea mangrovi]TKB46648.1 rhodanese-like domain-containing protein [Thalassotalea mangrovi]
MEQYVDFLSNHPVLSMAWLAIASLLIFTSVKKRFSSIKSISTQELTMLVNREDGVIVDIRADKDFRKGHIFGSKHLSAEKINSNELTSLEKYKDKPIIVVCAAGMTAVKAANQLSKAGFANVTYLQGGLSAWQSASLPISK